jgi:hypothetical protein
MIKAEFAVVTLVHDLLVIRRREFRHVALDGVNPIQQSVERRTKVEAAPAPVANLIDSQAFLFEGARFDRLQNVHGLHGYCNGPAVTRGGTD